MPEHGVFVVTGLPGSGKSTLARALARAVGLPLLAKDDIKEALLEALGAADAAASRRLSDASFAALFALAQRQLEMLGGVVLEGNFRPGEHEVALRPLLRAATPCTQLLCRVPEALRQARLAARAGQPGRHPGHRDAEWVAGAAPLADAFLDLPGPRHLHDGATAEPLAQCELIRSLSNRQLV